MAQSDAPISPLEETWGETKVECPLKFALLFRNRKALLVLQKTTPNAGFSVLNYEAELIEVHLPLKGQLNAERFRHRRSVALTATIEISRTFLQTWLNSKLLGQIVEGYTIESIHLDFRQALAHHPSSSLCLYISANHRSGEPLSLVVHLNLQSNQGFLSFVPLSVWFVGDILADEAKIMTQLAQRFRHELTGHSNIGWYLDIPRATLTRPIARYGWKAPDISHLQIDSIKIEHQTILIRLNRTLQALSEPTVEDDVHLPTWSEDPISTSLRSLAPNPSQSPGEPKPSFSFLLELLNDLAGFPYLQHDILRWQTRLAQNFTEEKRIETCKLWLRQSPENHLATRHLSIALATQRNFRPLLELLQSNDHNPLAEIENYKHIIAGINVQIELDEASSQSIQLLSDLLELLKANPQHQRVHRDGLVCLALLRIRHTPVPLSPFQLSAFALDPLEQAIEITKSNTRRSDIQRRVALFCRGRQLYAMEEHLLYQAWDNNPGDEHLIRRLIELSEKTENYAVLAELLRQQTGRSSADHENRKYFRQQQIATFVLSEKIELQLEARNILDASLKKDPDSIETLIWLASLDFRSNNWKYAAAHIDRILEIVNSEPGSDVKAKHETTLQIALQFHFSTLPVLGAQMWFNAGELENAWMRLSHLDMSAVDPKTANDCFELMQSLSEGFAELGKCSTLAESLIPALDQNQKFRAHLFCAEESTSFTDKLQHFIAASHYSQLSRRQLESLLQDPGHSIDPDHLALVGELAKKSGVEDFAASLYYRAAQRLAQQERHQQALLAFEQANAYYGTSPEFAWDFANSFVAVGESEQAILKLEVILRSIVQGQAIESNRGLGIVQLLIKLSDWERSEQLLRQLEETSQAPVSGNQLEVFNNCQYETWIHTDPQRALELVATQLELHSPSEETIWSKRVLHFHTRSISDSDWYNLFLRVPWHRAVAEIVHDKIRSDGNYHRFESFVHIRREHTQDTTEQYRLLDELATRLRSEDDLQTMNVKLIELYRDMIEIDSQDFATQHRLAKALQFSDDLEAAYQQWQSFATNLAPSDTLYLEVWTEIVRCAMIFHQWERAKSGLEAAFRYHENSSELAQMQLELAEQSNDKTLACDALEKLLLSPVEGPKKTQWRRYLAELQHATKQYNSAFSQLTLLLDDKEVEQRELLSILQLWITWAQELQDFDREADARTRLRNLLGDALEVEHRIEELSLMIMMKKSASKVLEQFRFDSAQILVSPSAPSTQILLRNLANLAQQSGSIQTLKRIIDAIESKGVDDQELVSWRDYYLANSGNNQSLFEELDISLYSGPVDSFTIQRLHQAHGNDYRATVRHFVHLIDRKWGLDIIDLCAAAIALLPKVEQLQSQATLAIELLLRIETSELCVSRQHHTQGSNSQGTPDSTRDDKAITNRTQVLKEQCWSHLEFCFGETEGGCNEISILEPTILISFPHPPSHLVRIFAQFVLNSTANDSIFSSVIETVVGSTSISEQGELTEFTTSLLGAVLSCCLESRSFDSTCLAHAYAQFARLLPTEVAASWIEGSVHFPTLCQATDFPLLHYLRAFGLWQLLFNLAESQQHAHRDLPEFWFAIAQWAHSDEQAVWEARARKHAGARLIRVNSLPAAVEQLERALELDPSQPKVRLQLAQCSEQLRQLDRALYHYLYLYQREEWQSAGIEHGLLAYACGRLTGMFGQTEQSLVFLQVAHECVDQNNRDQIAEQLYASYIALGKRNAALELANIAVGETEDIEQRTLWLLRAAECVEGWDRVEQLQIALALNPSASDLCNELVECMIAADDPPATIELIAKRLEQCETLDQAQPYLAALVPEILHQCSPDSVAKVWQKLLYLDPVNIRSLVELGQYHYDRHQLDKAHSLWSQAIAGAASDDEKIQEPLRIVARLAKERGEKNESIDLLERLLIILPDDEPALRQLLEISIELRDLPRILSYSEMLLPFSRDIDEKLKIILHCIRSHIYLQNWSSALDLLHSTTQVVKPSSAFHIELAQLWVLIAATCPDSAEQIEIQARTQLGLAYAEDLPIELLLQEIEVLEKHGLATKAIDRIALFLENDPSNLQLSTSIVSLARRHGLENKLAIVFLRLIETMEIGEIRDHYLLEIISLAHTSNFPQIVETAILSLSPVAQQRVPIDRHRQWAEVQKLKNSEAIPITAELLITSIDSSLPLKTSWQTFGLQIFERFERQMDPYLSFMLQRIEGISQERRELVLQQMASIVAEHDSTNYAAAFTILQTSLSLGLAPTSHWHILVESIVQSNDLVTFLALIEVLGRATQVQKSTYIPLLEALIARGLHLYPNETSIAEVFRRYFIGGKAISLIELQEEIELFSDQHRLDIVTRTNLTLICASRLPNHDVKSICLQLVERWPGHSRVLNRCSQELLKRSAWKELIRLYRLAQADAELWQDTADYLRTRNEYEYQAQCRLEAAQCFARQLDFTSAEKEFTRALQLTPDNFSLSHAYGVVLLEQRQYEKALEQLVPLVRTRSGKDTELRRSELALRCGQAAKQLIERNCNQGIDPLEYSIMAREMLELAIESADPGDSIIFQASEQLYPLLAKSDPEQAYALAWSTAQKCSFSDRRLWLHRAASTAPDHARSTVLIECLRLNPKDQDLVHSALAQCHQSQEHSQIDTIYEFLIANANLLGTERSQIIRLHLERIAMHSGTDDRSLAPQLEALLRITPDNIDARISLARLRERNRDRLGSVRHWEIALPMLASDDPRKAEALLAIIRNALASDSQESAFAAWLEWSTLAKNCDRDIFKLFWNTLEQWEIGQNQLQPVFEKIQSVGPQLMTEAEFHVCIAQFWHREGKFERLADSLRHAPDKISRNSSDFRSLAKLWASACYRANHHPSECPPEVQHLLFELQPLYAPQSSPFLAILKARRSIDETQDLHAILTSWELHADHHVLLLASRAICIRWRQPLAFTQTLHRIIQQNLCKAKLQELTLELVYQARSHGDANRCLQALDRLRDAELEPKGYRQWCLVSLKKGEDQTELIYRQLLEEPNVEKVRELLDTSNVDLETIIQGICQDVIPKSGSRLPMIISVVLEIISANDDLSLQIRLALNIFGECTVLDYDEAIDNWWSSIDKKSISSLPDSDLRRLVNFFLGLANNNGQTNAGMDQATQVVGQLIGQLLASSLNHPQSENDEPDPSFAVFELCKILGKHRPNSEVLAVMFEIIEKWSLTYPLVGSHRISLYSLLSRFDRFGPDQIAPTLFKHALSWSEDLGALTSAFMLLDQWDQLESCRRLVLEHPQFKDDTQRLKYLAQRQDDNDDQAGQALTLQSLAGRYLQLDQIEECQLANRRVANLGFAEVNTWVSVQYSLAKRIESQQSLMFAVDAYFDLFLIPPADKSSFSKTTLDLDRTPGEYFGVSQRVAAKLLELCKSARAMAILRRAYDVLQDTPTLKVKIAEQLYQLLRSSTDRSEKQSLVEFALIHTKDNARIPWLLRSYRIDDADSPKNAKVLAEAWSISPTDATVVETYEQFLDEHGDLPSFLSFVQQRFEQLAFSGREHAFTLDCLATKLNKLLDRKSVNIDFERHLENHTDKKTESRVLEFIVQVLPTHTQSVRRLAAHYESQGLFAQSIAILEPLCRSTLVQNSERVSSYLKVARLADKNNNHTQAISAIEQGLALEPRNIDLLITLLDILDFKQHPHRASSTIHLLVPLLLTHEHRLQIASKLLEKAWDSENIVIVQSILFSVRDWSQAEPIFRADFLLDWIHQAQRARKRENNPSQSAVWALLESQGRAEYRRNLGFSCPLDEILAEVDLSLHPLKDPQLAAFVFSQALEICQPSIEIIVQYREKFSKIGGQRQFMDCVAEQVRTTKNHYRRDQLALLWASLAMELKLDHQISEAASFFSIGMSNSPEVAEFRQWFSHSTESPQPPPNPRPPPVPTDPLHTQISEFVQHGSLCGDRTTLSAAANFLRKLSDKTFDEWKSQIGDLLGLTRQLLPTYGPLDSEFRETVRELFSQHGNEVILYQGWAGNNPQDQDSWFDELRSLINVGGLELASICEGAAHCLEGQSRVEWLAKQSRNLLHDHIAFAKIMDAIVSQSNREIAIELWQHRSISTQDDQQRNLSNIAIIELCGQSAQHLGLLEETLNKLQLPVHCDQKTAIFLADCYLAVQQFDHARELLDLHSSKNSELNDRLSQIKYHDSSPLQQQSLLASLSDHSHYAVQILASKSRAEILLESGDRSTAIDIYRDLLNQFPNLRDVWTQLTTLLAEMSQWQQLAELRDRYKVHLTGIERIRNLFELSQIYQLHLQDQDQDQNQAELQLRNALAEIQLLHPRGDLYTQIVSNLVDLLLRQHRETEIIDEFYYVYTNFLEQRGNWSSSELELARKLGCVLLGRDEYKDRAIELFLRIESSGTRCPEALDAIRPYLRNRCEYSRLYRVLSDHVSEAPPSTESSQAARFVSMQMERAELLEKHLQQSKLAARLYLDLFAQNADLNHEAGQRARFILQDNEGLTFLQNLLDHESSRYPPASLALLHYVLGDLMVSQESGSSDAKFHYHRAISLDPHCTLASIALRKLSEKNQTKAQRSRPPSDSQSLISGQNIPAIPAFSSSSPAAPLVRSLSKPANTHETKLDAASLAKSIEAAIQGQNWPKVCQLAQKFRKILKVPSSQQLSHSSGSSIDAQDPKQTERNDSGHPILLAVVVVEAMLSDREQSLELDFDDHSIEDRQQYLYPQIEVCLDTFIDGPDDINKIDRLLSVLAQIIPDPSQRYSEFIHYVGLGNASMGRTMARSLAFSGLDRPIQATLCRQLVAFLNNGRNRDAEAGSVHILLQSAKSAPFVESIHAPTEIVAVLRYGMTQLRDVLSGHTHASPPRKGVMSSEQQHAIRRAAKTLQPWRQQFELPLPINIASLPQGDSFRIKNYFEPTIMIPENIGDYRNEELEFYLAKATVQIISGFALIIDPQGLTAESLFEMLLIAFDHDSPLKKEWNFVNRPLEQHLLQTLHTHGRPIFESWPISIQRQFLGALRHLTHVWHTASHASPDQWMEQLNRACDKWATRLCGRLDGALFAMTRSQNLEHLVGSLHRQAMIGQESTNYLFRGLGILGDA